MNFDVFDNIEMNKKDKELLLSSCKAAERSIMVSPKNSMIDARTGLEKLCKVLIKEKEIEQIRPDNGIPNLATMIDTCLQNGVFHDSEAARVIRKHGNDTAHPKNNRLHIVNEENVKKAIESVESLYRILGEVYGINKKFDLHQIPFGFYEIVRVIPKAKREVIYGDYNYFTVDPKGNYYYFQVFPRNSMLMSDNELGERGVLTGKKIKEDKSRKSYLLDVHYPSNVMAESDRDYIAYSVFSDSMLLSEIKEQLSEVHTIQIALDLLSVLQELHRIGSGIHLRNIQPGNIIITPNGKNYMAGIVNMETSKIEGYATTVYASMKDLLAENAYLPKVIRNKLHGANVPWEKVDVYSIAVVMLFCREKSLVKENINTYDLYDFFSDEMVDLLTEVLDSSLNEIDGVDDFKEKLESVLAKL